MNFGLTEEQEMLKKTARDFLATECPGTLVREMEAGKAGYPAGLWQKMAALGWLGLVFPEEYGGAGGSFIDLMVLLEEMGRACLPGPFFSSVVLGGLCILEAGSEAQKRELLPRISRGDLILTLALTEPSANYEPASITMDARADKESYVINGTKLFVTDANVADYLVCVTRTAEGTDAGTGITLFLVDTRSSGIESVLLKTIDDSQQCEVSFRNIRVPRDNLLGELDGGWPVIEKVLTWARVAKCAEMLGGLSRVLEMSQQYAKDRIQFGHPIGVNQAIQFHCANMMIDADIARFMTYKAAWSISEGLPATKEVAAAKAWISDAYPRVTYLGQLVHGGIAFCLEHDMSLYIKRAKAAEVTFGDASLHREIIAQEMGL